MNKLKENKRYLFLGTSLFGFLIILILLLTNNITSFDTKIYNFIFSFRSNTMDTILKIITKFGNTIPILWIVIIFLLNLNKKDGIILGSNTIITVSINQIIKNIIKRERPSHLRLINQGGYSFPSGHAMIAVCVYGTLLYFVLTKIKDKPVKIILSITLIFLILLIGISRIYVGVHYPSDVLAGYFLSIVVLISNITLCNKYFRGNKNDKNGC